jgi:hypothetical protein
MTKLATAVAVATLGAASASAEPFAPGPEHQWLRSSLAGSWSTHAKGLGPHGEAMESTGTAEIKSAHGDRFLVEEFANTRAGKPMSGTIWWGYDGARKKFTTAEIDSTGTSITALTGVLDDATKTITLTGNGFSHVLNREAPMRIVVHVESDKKHTVQIFGAGPDGKEVRRVEIAYERK